MASSTKEEMAQMIAQLQDSGQNAGVCIMAEMKKDRDWEIKALQARIKELENSLSIALEINDRDQRERKKLCEQLDLKQKELDKSNKEKIVFRESGAD